MKHSLKIALPLLFIAFVASNCKKDKEDPKPTVLTASTNIQAKIDEYNEANKAYFEALEEKVKAESEIKLAKYELEGVLGTRWEAVEKMKTAYENAEKEQKKEIQKEEAEKEKN